MIDVAVTGQGHGGFIAADTICAMHCIDVTTFHKSWKVLRNMHTVMESEWLTWGIAFKLLRGTVHGTPVSHTIALQQDLLISSEKQAPTSITERGIYIDDGAE